MLNKYNKGGSLIFIGNSKSFSKGHSYKISKIEKIDYKIDELYQNFGKDCLYFEDCELGCVVEWAHTNFKNIIEYREDKLNEILR